MCINVIVIDCRLCVLFTVRLLIFDLTHNNISLLSNTIEIVRREDILLKLGLVLENVMIYY